MIDESKLNILRLDPGHNFLPFDCGDADLNEFLLADAKDYLHRLLSVTYVFEYQGCTLAFFSLSNDKIQAEQFDTKSQFRKIQSRMPWKKRFSSYPAVKLGRLGVTAEYQRNGFGKYLLDYIKGMFIVNNRTGCQYITVDAYAQSLKFYENNGFKYFTTKDDGDDTRQMYYSLLDLVEPQN